MLFGFDSCCLDATHEYLVTSSYLPCCSVAHWFAQDDVVANLATYHDISAATARLDRESPYLVSVHGLMRFVNLYVDVTILGEWNA